MATTTLFTDGLKELYHSQIETQMNNDCVLKDALDESNKGIEVGGRGFYFPVKLTRGGAAGSIAEGAAVPPVGTNKSPSARGHAIPSGEFVANISLTSMVMAASKGGNKAAFVDALQNETENAADELSRNFNRQLFGNKPASQTTTFTSGVLARVTTGANSASQTIKNGYANHFYAGQRLLFGTAADLAAYPGVAGSVVTGVVQSVDSETGITLVGAANTVTNDLITTGDATFNSYSREMTGLDAIAKQDDDNLYEVDTGLNAGWRALVMGNGGDNRPMTRELMDALGNNLKNTGGGQPDLVICHSSAQQEIVGTMTGDVRYMPLVFKGGYKRSALTWVFGNTDVGIVTDVHCPLRKVFAFQKAKLQLGYLKKFGWLDMDGAVLSRLSGVTTFGALYTAIAELVCLQRNSVGVISDLQINTSNMVFGQS